MKLATPRGRSGFSLVEVLLAVLVLGLGLLGLAAVFPVVITQQRDAGESVQATGVVASVEALLERGAYADGLRSLLLNPGFGRLVSTPPVDGSNNPRNDNADWVRDGTMLWQPTLEWDGHEQTFVTGFGGGTTSELLYTDGGVQFGVGEVLLWNGTGFDSAMPMDPLHTGVYALPMDARLFPLPRSGGEPRFVWDVVPRRDASNGLEVAIFVRSIETGFRVPAGATLSDVVRTNRPAAASAAGAPRVLPVGMHPDEVVPTGRGAPVGGSADAVYAAPLCVEAELPDPGTNPFEHDLVLLRAPTPSTMPGVEGLPAFTGDAWQAVVARPGQTVVDNLGVVRRVAGEVTTPPPWLNVGAGEVLVRVSPAYGPSAVRGAADIVSATVGQRATQLYQFLFTPQPPVRVFVLRLR